MSTLEYGIHTQWRAGDYALLVVIFITASGFYWFAYARRASSWGKTLTPLYVVMFIGFIIHLVARKEIANYIATHPFTHLHPPARHLRVLCVLGG